MVRDPFEPMQEVEVLEPSWYCLCPAGPEQPDAFVVRDLDNQVVGGAVWTLVFGSAGMPVQACKRCGIVFEPGMLTSLVPAATYYVADPDRPWHLCADCGYELRVACVVEHPEHSGV